MQPFSAAVNYIIPLLLFSQDFSFVAVRKKIRLAAVEFFLLPPFHQQNKHKNVEERTASAGDAALNFHTKHEISFYFQKLAPYVHTTSEEQF
jgi:hypothetical protein